MKCRYSVRRTSLMDGFGIFCYSTTSLKLKYVVGLCVVFLRVIVDGAFLSWFFMCTASLNNSD